MAVAFDNLTLSQRVYEHLRDEILAPLTATPGVTLNVTIEIEATNPDGYDDAKIRTVSENATTLKFEQAGFEEK